MTKLIFACDVSDLALGQTLIQKTAPYVDVVKIGLEAMTAEDNTGITLASQLRRYTGNMGRQVMWDNKLLDIENTMAKAARNIARLGSHYFTIHATASNAALAAVAEAAGSSSMPLAVTVLTDLDDPQCVSRFGNKVAPTVKNFAKNARRWGIRGFVCSPKEAKIIRDAVPDAFIVTPGVRPVWAVAPDEQKRVTTPADAKNAGANAIVVGRPISNPPKMYTEAEAAREIKAELEAT